MLAALTGGEVVCHARGGARLSEQLNPNTRLGARTQAALAGERWDYVVLQEMSHGPIKMCIRDRVISDTILSARLVLLFEYS